MDDLERKAMELYWASLSLEDIWWSTTDDIRHIWRTKAEECLNIYEDDQKFLDKLFRKNIVSFKK